MGFESGYEAFDQSLPITCSTMLPLDKYHSHKSQRVMFKATALTEAS